MNWYKIKTYAIYISEDHFKRGDIQCYGIDLTERQLEYLKETGQVVVLIKEETIQIAKTLIRLMLSILRR